MFQLERKSTALIVIDMQNAFLDSSSPYCVAGAEQLLSRVAEVVTFARAQKLPIVFTKVILNDELDGGPFSKNWLSHGFDEVGILRRGTKNVEVHRALQPHSDDLVLEKPRYSAFFATRLDNLLRSRGIETLVITGADTKFCVLSTSRDAQFRDYQVVVLSDCISTGGLPDLGWGAVSPLEVEKVLLSTIAIGDGEVMRAEEFKRRLDASVVAPKSVVRA